MYKNSDFDIQKMIDTNAWVINYVFVNPWPPLTKIIFDIAVFSRKKFAGETAGKS
jgi:hypothetical protein